jgi:diaminohydroxyphosphoribosylaminopyrimidine deaminase/5-amino-6-(5-phosphoribosylamino)uracil reductase
MLGEIYRKGDHHAEVNALAAAGERAGGGTAVVTLEPCNHHGRTPPCRQALIDAKVSRVLMAVMDPTSRGDGGAAVLERAGIEVERGVLEQEALLVLGPWLHSLRTGRPYITWAYGDRAVNELRSTHDLVIRRNGAIEEGAPGGHGEGAFHIPHHLADDDPEAALRALAEAGARAVLLEGASNDAARLLADAVDRVIVDVPRTPPSSGPTAVSGKALPDGFRMVAVQPMGRYVRLTAERAP